MQLDPGVTRSLYCAMVRALALLRHGLASGQGPDAALVPQGTRQIERLASALRAEGWRPDLVLSSPYARALESARTLAGGVGYEAPPLVLHELLPESEPLDALQAIDAAAPGVASILVVSHLPLVGRLTFELTHQEVPFSPGTFVELRHDSDGLARLVRRIAPLERGK